MRRALIALLGAGALALAGAMAYSGRAFSQEGTAGYGMGPGMMGGYGMGPGMMGGYGMGTGMMGGYGMGPGMMGGYGMGPGMMNGYGMGPIWRLDLTDTQRTKINAIADQLRIRHWAIMGKIIDDRVKLRDLYAVSAPDPKAVGSVYADIGKLQEEMAQAHVQAINQARSVLTKEQIEQLDKWLRRGWAAGGGY